MTQVEFTQEELTHLAIYAYVAYGDLRNWKTHDGKSMPQWDHIGQEIQSAWRVAVRAAVKEYAEHMNVFR